MAMREMVCDTFVVGGGTAGLEAFRAASEAGADCVLADAGRLGTTAQRSGELPASYLMSAGLAAHAPRTFGRYGLTAPEFEVESTGVLGMVRAQRSRATSSVLSFLYRIPEEKRLRGTVTFEDAHTARVGDDARVRFKTAVIATGTAPLVTYEQSQIKDIITTNEFYEQDRIPSSAAVFGSTSVGLQLGQAMAYLGSDVTVFGQRRLWNLTDEEVLSSALEMLSSRFSLAVDSFITSIDPEDDGYSIYYIDGGRFENYLHTSEVIAATARIPNVGGMNLQRIGVKLSPEGYIVTHGATMQSSLSHIFAAGSVRGSSSTSVAELEGRYAGINAARGCSGAPCASLPETVNLEVCFTDPVLAIAGLSFEKMKQRAVAEDMQFIATHAEFSDIVSGGRHHRGGVIGLYTDVKTHRIMGAEICSQCADHLAQLVAFAIRKQAKVEEFPEFDFLHMSGEEVLAQAAAEAVRRLTGSSGYTPLLQPQVRG